MSIELGVASIGLRVGGSWLLYLGSCILTLVS